VRKKNIPANSSLKNQRFSIQYAIRSIKYLRKSELCKSGKHDWTYVFKKGYEFQDYYKCKQCNGKKSI